MSGYKNPPKETQFKKGVSGNPKGRSKGSKNFLSLLEKIVEQKISIKQEGAEIKITKKEAMLMQWINKGVKGDVNAVQRLVPWLLQIDQKNKERDDEQKLSLKDQDIMEHFMNKYNRGEKND
ncbi:MAG: hypothetical protein IJ660_05870 [Alphaproteobacteria bacterium]|nr:hypothetical protein [Alphaproteobacteria bacterium]